MAVSWIDPGNSPRVVAPQDGHDVARDRAPGTNDVEVRVEGGGAVLSGPVAHKRLKSDLGDARSRGAASSGRITVLEGTVLREANGVGCDNYGHKHNHYHPPAGAAARRWRVLLSRPAVRARVLHYLVYVSSAVVPFSPPELVELLAASRRKNDGLGISGMLLYKDGNLMQVLEGEEAAVQGLYARIARDPRHRGLLVLSQGALAARQFPDWSMSFRDLNTTAVRSLPGYSEFMNTALTGLEFSTDPSRCQRLLTTFKRSMQRGKSVRE